MKHEKWLSCLTGVLLSFGIAFAGALCLLTAFNMEADLAVVAAICAICAAACGICFTLRRGGLMLLAGLAMLIGYLLREGTVWLHIESLLYRVTRYYDMAYGWGTIWWSGIDLMEVPVTGALGLLGGGVAICVAWTVCRRKNAFLAAVVAFLPLAACFVVTDSIPEEKGLYFLILGLALLLITNPVRRADPRQGLRLTAMLLVPAVLASTLLFWLNPREEYQNRMESLQDKLMGWVSELPFVVTTPDGELTIDLGGEGGDRVDLTQVGPKTLRRYPVMDVVAQRGGVIYLRGQSLDVYSGTGWNASEVSTGKDMFFPTENMEDAGRLTVSVRMTQTRRYIPYYISEEYQMVEGTLENEDTLREYGYWVRVPMAGYTHISDSVTVDMNRPILYQCLQLPDATRMAADEILNEIFGATVLPAPGDDIFYDDTTQRAERIREFVEGSARYSLNTQQMPAGESDFAIWFLEESETGYCIHFASALTVLLRAAGIPARYVTGYTFEARGGVKTVVRAANAHAWVEYLDPNSGWTVIDGTPSEWMEDEADTTQPEDTEPETTVPTEPVTEPEPTQEATEPVQTQPEDTTDATAPDGGAEPGDTQKTDISWLVTVLKVAVWIGGFAVLVGGQYYLRRSLRRKKMGSGHRNRRALACWQEARRMSRLTGKAVPDELRELAEKAKYSQHTLTQAELLEFKLWLAQAEGALREKPWIVRLALKLIWAVA